MAVDSACSNILPSLKFVGYTLSVSALISLVAFTFELLIGRGMGNLPTNFGVSWNFRSRLMGPTPVRQIT